MTRTQKPPGEFECNCPRPFTEHMPEHASWCNYLKPRPVPARDPARFAAGDVVRALTGAPLRTDAELQQLHDETHRLGVAVTQTPDVPFGPKAHAQQPCPACGALSGCLHGIHASIGVDEPLTYRPGEYLGQPRNAVLITPEGVNTPVPHYLGQPRLPLTIAAAGLPAAIRSLENWRQVDEWILIEPHEQTLIDGIKQGATAGELRKAIDRYTAFIYDQISDLLAGRKQEYSRRFRK